MSDGIILTGLVKKFEEKLNRKLRVEELAVLREAIDRQITVKTKPVV